MKKLTKTLALVAMTLPCVGAFAATNPVAATANSSTGDVQVLLSKGEAVRISGLDDIDFGITTGQPANQGDTACVHTTSTNYDVIATSTHGIAGIQGFRMADATNTNFIRYRVLWNDGATPQEDLPEAAVSVATFIGDAVNETCLGGTNVTITVNPNNGDFTAAPPGAYDDTLTLLVSAQ